MADPICRWRNASVKQVCEFNQLLPLEDTPKAEAHSYTENQLRLWDGGNNFFKTAYQLAAQMGIYYDSDDTTFVRFHRLIMLKEAEAYINGWARRYYVPNPYTASLADGDVFEGKTVILNNFLVNWVAEHGETPWAEIKKILFPNGIGNDDILQNLLNNFTDIEISDGIVKVKTNAWQKHYDEVFIDANRKDKAGFFHFFDRIKYELDFDFGSQTTKEPKEEPLQLIYYGAPGTGKSFTIDKMAKDENSVRTTFHPDTDYASFVGAYKPTMESVRINAISGKDVTFARGEGGHPGTEKKIVYKYVPQAFLKAYVAAWKNLDEPFYLVIEEINRGNCAQIFGDLFHLLDRNNVGCSSYPINADEDIRQFLATDGNGFGNLTEEQRQSIYDFVLRKDNDKVLDIGPEILSGEKLLLPPNLRIWATMNTSDQSLFPIDSAFKRRWNWKYMPIAYDRENWRFEVDGNLYMWGDFLHKINPIIARLTESSDKQMGYYFAKANPKTGIISEEVFLNKVLFYLWTDVLKDYSVGEKEFIDPDTKKPYAFTDFFNEDGTPSDAVGKFITTGLELTPVEEVVTDNETDADEPVPADGKNPYYPPFKELVVKFPDGEELKGPIRATYIKAIEKIGVDRVEPIAADMRYKRRNSPLVAKEESQAILDDPTYKYVKIGDCYVMLGMKNITVRAFLRHVSEQLGLGLEVELV